LIACGSGETLFPASRRGGVGLGFAMSVRLPGQANRNSLALPTAPGNLLFAVNQRTPITVMTCEIT